MDSINRVNWHSKIVSYPGAPKKVERVSKDEKNKQQDQKKKESFKDIFEKTQTEKKD
jgi:hypothetical protein